MELIKPSLKSEIWAVIQYLFAENIQTKEVCSHLFASYSENIRYVNADNLQMMYDELHVKCPVEEHTAKNKH